MGWQNKLLMNPHCHWCAWYVHVSTIYIYIRHVWYQIDYAGTNNIYLLSGKGRNASSKLTYVDEINVIMRWQSNTLSLVISYLIPLSCLSNNRIRLSKSFFDNLLIIDTETNTCLFSFFLFAFHKRPLCRYINFSSYHYVGVILVKWRNKTVLWNVSWIHIIQNDIVCLHVCCHIIPSGSEFFLYYLTLYYIFIVLCLKEENVPALYIYAVCQSSEVFVQRYGLTIILYQSSQLYEVQLIKSFRCNRN